MWCEHVIAYMCDLTSWKNHVYIYRKIILTKTMKGISASRYTLKTNPTFENKLKKDQKQERRRKWLYIHTHRHLCSSLGKSPFYLYIKWECVRASHK